MLSHVKSNMVRICHVFSAIHWIFVPRLSSVGSSWVAFGALGRPLAALPTSCLLRWLGGHGHRRFGMNHERLKDEKRWDVSSISNSKLDFVTLSSKIVVDWGHISLEVSSRGTMRREGETLIGTCSDMATRDMRLHCLADILVVSQRIVIVLVSQIS